MATHKFQSVEDMLVFLPEEERRVTDILRAMISESLPYATEKLSYNVPFYKVHSNICFIWPGAVLWGNKRSYEGVRLGFNKGYLMSDEASILNRGDRKEVYWCDFLHPRQIDQDLLRTYMQEAAVIDEELNRMKKSK